MNKKGIFVALLSILTIFLLLATAIVIIKNNDIRQEKIKTTIGQDAQSLILLADEYNKYRIYIHEAIPFAEQRAREIVAKNGGYAKNNTCQKIQKSITDIYSYVLLNTCETFNPRQAYYTQLAEEIEKYLKAHYPLQNEICLTKELKPLKVVIDEKGMHMSKQFPLNPCTDQQKTEIEMNVQIDEPLKLFNDERYEYVYDVLSSCSDLKTCQERIQILLPQSTIQIQEEILFITGPDLKMAFKLEQLPQRQQSNLFSEL